jgi:CHAD domain
MDLDGGASGSPHRRASSPTGASMPQPPFADGFEEVGVGGLAGVYPQARREGARRAPRRRHARRQHHESPPHDRGVRLGSDPEDLHRIRVAVRGARAILRSARPILDRAASEPLRAELKCSALRSGPRATRTRSSSSVKTEGPPMGSITIPAARLYLLDENSKIKSPRRSSSRPSTTNRERPAVFAASDARQPERGGTGPRSRLEPLLE